MSPTHLKSESRTDGEEERLVDALVQEVCHITNLWQTWRGLFVAETRELRERELGDVVPNMLSLFQAAGSDGVLLGLARLVDGNRGTFNASRVFRALDQPSGDSRLDTARAALADLRRRITVIGEHRDCRIAHRNYESMQAQWKNLPQITIDEVSAAIASAQSLVNLMLVQIGKPEVGFEDFAGSDGAHEMLGLVATCYAWRRAHTLAYTVSAEEVVAYIRSAGPGGDQAPHERWAHLSHG